MKRFTLSILLVLLAVPCLAGTRDLKQSTAITVAVGPFMDPTTGAPETSLTVTSIDGTLFKATGTASDLGSITASGGSNDMVHQDDGMYSLELTTTNTDTAGPLTICLYIADALVIKEDFNVLPANIYDSKYSTDKLEVDVTLIEGTDATDQITTYSEDGADAALVTYDGPTNTEFEARTIAAASYFDFTTDSVLLSSGTGAGQISLSSGLLAWNPAWDSEAQSEAADALTAYDPPTRTEATADKVEILKGLSGFTAVVYVATTDDAEQVIEAQSAGTLCILAPGTHAMGSDALTVPDGVSVVGAGRDVTVLTSTNTDGVILTPGDNCLLSDFTLQSLNVTEGVFDFPLGATSGSFTNAVCRNLRIIGRTDGIYVTTSTPCSAVFENVITETKYDSWLTFGAAHQFTWIDCEARLTVDNETDAGTAVSLRGVEGAYKIINSRIRVENPLSGTATSMIGVYTHASDDVRVEIFNSQIALVGAASSSNFVIDHNSSGLMQTIGCDYDRTKTDGTITDVRGGLMGLVADAITASTHDESTSFPLAQVDSGATAPLRTGADSDTGETLSDEIAALLAAIFTDAHAEPTGAPAANESLSEKLGFLFATMRNKVTVTATEKTVYDDSDSEQWHKELQDDGTTYQESEAAAAD